MSDSFDLPERLTLNPEQLQAIGSVITEWAKAEQTLFIATRPWRRRVADAAKDVAALKDLTQQFVRNPQKVFEYLRDLGADFQRNLGAFLDEHIPEDPFARSLIRKKVLEFWHSVTGLAQRVKDASAPRGGRETARSYWTETTAAAAQTQQTAEHVPRQRLRPR